MNLVIIGAGRMGLRHAQGALRTKEVRTLTLVDISGAALEKAKETLGNEEKTAPVEFLLYPDFAGQNRTYDVAILASTANDRLSLLKLLRDKGCTEVLAEKPLGQSMEQVLEFVGTARDLGISCSVNLNMRLYPFFRQLRDEFQTLPQLASPLTVTVNTGAIGIGANGIHYIDLLFFLLDADEAHIVCAQIDDTPLPSGRGPQFGDFGGWSVIKLYKAGEYKGMAFMSLTAESSAIGSWEFVGPNGRVFLNELEGKKAISMRKADSPLPIHRYAADYLPVEWSTFESPMLSDLTAQWLKGLTQGLRLLPSVEESIPAHRLLFDWLAFSKTHQKKYPIT